MPRFFLQFGPGFSLDGLFDSQPQEAFLHDIAGLPDTPTLDSHVPRFLYGMVRGVPVLAADGHRHISEGNGLLPCLIPLATAWKIGAKRQIFVDSGISLRQEIKMGHWMLLVDTINGFTFSPTDGHHHLFENTYPDMTQTFSQRQNSELMNALAAAGISPKLGIYMGRPGFHTSTHAETAIAQNSGADILGHELVLEVMFAYALGAEVSAFALATSQWNKASSSRFSRKEALETCRQCSPDFIRGLAKAIHELDQPVVDFVPLPESQADEILSKPVIPKEQRRSPLRAFLPKYED